MMAVRSVPPARGMMTTSKADGLAGLPLNQSGHFMHFCLTFGGASCIRLTL